MNQPIQRLAEIREEREKRERDFLKCYRPSPAQREMHACPSSEIIVRGGKRSGKSVSTSAEFASRVTGLPIIDQDGNEIPNHWPKPTPDYPRIYWIIGWATDHIGQTIHRLLFEKGQGGSFRVIKDKDTGKWRTYNRADPEDVKRLKESKLSEPLIPPRMIKQDSWVWENKGANVFESVELINGAKIYAYPSSARNPKQGDAVSGIWIDEDIQIPGHLKEWQDRLTDEEGFLMWSVWPHNKNEALVDLIERAEMASLDPEPQISSFQLIMSSNPFLTDKGKRESLGRMVDEEEIARRDRGELLQDSLSMYRFQNKRHQIQRPVDGMVSLYDLPKNHKFLRDMWLDVGTFPSEWTRYLSIDPSNTRTAVHSWVIPPRDYQGFILDHVVICEWELIARRFSADLLAKSLKDKMGLNRYEAFIMDQNAGRQTHAGRDTTTMQHYGAAFEKHKIQSRQTGGYFIPGCNVPPERYRCVRELLSDSVATGMPRMIFVEEACPETRKEFGKYRKKTEARGEGVDSVLDVPANPRLFDCMASVEYFSAYILPQLDIGGAWVDPALNPAKKSPLVERVERIKAKERRNKDPNVVYFG